VSYVSVYWSTVVSFNSHLWLTAVLWGGAVVGIDGALLQGGVGGFLAFVVGGVFGITLCRLGHNI
jgi:hypothetical protein